ncbi:hypothetical protein GM661_05515 [Iocasia frigidifontis]|uniref:Uncharacterized protein n=1 Tax=Iocasia fonsfrigidae TaxID=2682810 RepID=A0A8A7KCZ3_9FIRM|nr:hypothetical protein [Iocasia fonsfrigidae]QTL97478.1 hypothetical protein GM661_05515 [Iocasia fonsfrigidae]
MPKKVYPKKLKESVLKRLAPPNAEKASDLYYIKTIGEPQFKININLNKEIFFSEERRDYYIINNGENVYISITRGNSWQLLMNLVKIIEVL